MQVRIEYCLHDQVRLFVQQESDGVNPINVIELYVSEMSRGLYAKVEHGNSVQFDDEDEGYDDSEIVGGPGRPIVLLDKELELR